MNKLKKIVVAMILSSMCVIVINIFENSLNVSGFQENLTQEINEFKNYNNCELLIDAKEAEFLIGSVMIDEIESDETRSNDPIVVRGTIIWEHAENQFLPLRYMLVEILNGRLISSDGDIQRIGVVYTNTYGEFEFSFQSGILKPHVLLRVFPESSTFHVHALTYKYSLFSKTINSVSSGTTLTFDLQVPLDTESNTVKVFYVAQGMVVGQRFALAMGNLQINKKSSVLYPAPIIPDDRAFAWSVFSGIGAKRYNDIDVLIHEYGHLLQSALGILNISLWDYFKHGMQHHLLEDLLDRGKKSHYMNLAWSESWATAFSIIAQRYFMEDYHGMSTFGDWKYSEITDVRLLSIGNNSGFGQEASLIGMLVNLFESRTISLGFQGWWDLTTTAGTYTLNDFVTNVDSYFPEYRSQIGQLMERVNISPRNIELLVDSNNLYVGDDLSLSTPPQIKFLPGGSKNHPNNHFMVKFFDQNNQLIHSTNLTADVIYDEGKVIYQVGQSDWEAITSEIGDPTIINIQIVGYNLVGDLEGGPHFSSYKRVVVHPFYTTNLDNGNLAITHFRGQIIGEITIPEVIAGRSVTIINSRVFANQSLLRKITLPKTITNVGEFTFSNTDNIIINLVGRTSITGNWHQDWNPHGHQVQFNGVNCSHNFIRNGNLETCSNCMRIRPTNPQGVDHLHGREIRNNNPVMVDVWIKTGSSDTDQYDVRIHIHLRPNQIYVIPNEYFSNNYVDVWFRINGVNTGVIEVNNQKLPIPIAPTIVSGRIIRNDNWFHVNVWISYDSSGDGDSFTYIFRDNLTPGQTVVVPTHGNHWSGFTIWFEAQGKSSPSIWFS